MANVETGVAAYLLNGSHLPQDMSAENMARGVPVGLIMEPQ